MAKYPAVCSGESEICQLLGLWLEAGVFMPRNAMLLDSAKRNAKMRAKKILGKA